MLPPWNEARVASCLNALADPDGRIRVHGCRAVAEQPSGDARVRAVVERLLEDDTPALISIPYSYGEVRSVACEAVIAERRAAGLTEPLTLVHHRSLSSNALGLAFEASGLPRPVAADPHAKQCMKYALLRSAGKVTTWTFYGDPTLPPIEWP